VSGTFSNGCQSQEDAKTPDTKAQPVHHLRPVASVHAKIRRVQIVLPKHGARRQNSRRHEGELVSSFFTVESRNKLGERNSMSMSDPIADYLTRVRNAVRARHKKVDVPASGLKKEITRILMEQKFITSYTTVEDAKQGMIRIMLKYNDTRSVITGLRRISRPGIRRYQNAGELPRVNNGLGVAVLSTSKGLMTDKQARKENIGGEVLFYVW
jgi:small subunit ribosomal protein S8